MNKKRTNRSTLTILLLQSIPKSCRQPPSRFHSISTSIDCPVSSKMFRVIVSEDSSVNENRNVELKNEFNQGKRRCPIN